MTGADPRWLRWVNFTGFAAWGVFIIADVALAIRDPDFRSVIGVYHRAALDWWQGKDIWGAGIDGFLYLPSFAVIFTPFALLGRHVGDIAWHLVSLALLFGGLWQVYRRLIDRPMLQHLGATLLIALPAAAGAVRNGQATVAMFGCMLLASTALADRRWVAVGLWLGAAVAIKPLAVVMALLVAAVYPRTVIPLLVAIVTVLAVPFLNSDPQAVAVAYGAMTRKLLAAASPPPEHFANLAGLFAVVGIAISDLVTVLLRIAMAGAALLLAFRARQILAPADAAFGLLALASTYLMLFSPRTEANTYVMLVFPVALYAAQLWRRDNRRGAAWLLTGLCLGLGSNAYGTLIFQATKIWLQPLLGASFAAVFLAPRLARRAHGPGSSSVKP